MKYKVTFSVTDTYPSAEIEAKDRQEAMKLYQEQYENGVLGLKEKGVQKDAKYDIQNVWKPNGH